MVSPRIASEAEERGGSAFQAEREGTFSKRGENRDQSVEEMR